MVQKLTVVALIALVTCAAAVPTSYDGESIINVGVEEIDVKPTLPDWTWTSEWAKGPWTNYGGVGGYGFGGNLGAKDFYGSWGKEPWANYESWGHGPWPNNGAWGGPGLSANAFNPGVLGGLQSYPVPNLGQSEVNVKVDNNKPGY